MTEKKNDLIIEENDSWKKVFKNLSGPHREQLSDLADKLEKQKRSSGELKKIVEKFINYFLLYNSEIKAFGKTISFYTPRYKTKIKKEQVTDLCETCLKFYECGLRIYNEKEEQIVESCKTHSNIEDLPYKSLDDQYKVFERWLPGIDTKRIDLRNALFLSNQEVGNPIWIVEIARSGQRKSTLTDAYIHCAKIVFVDQLTPRALISGRSEKGKAVYDIGMRLTKRNRIMIIGETASLKAMQRGEQRETFAVMKSLHDGRMKRDTGSGVNKYYDDCNTSAWFNSTRDFLREYVIHQEIGTCYLVYVVKSRYENDERNAEHAVKNRYEAKKMKEELEAVTQSYLAHHHLDTSIKLEDDDVKFIVKQAHRLIYLRMTGSLDSKHELEYTPNPEAPMRVAQELAKLFQALLSLKKDYSKERAKEIIKDVVISSSDEIFIKIYNYLLNYYSPKGMNPTFSVANVASSTGMGTTTIKKRLEILVGLEVLKRIEYTGVGRRGWHYEIMDKKYNEIAGIIHGKEFLKSYYKNKETRMKNENEEVNRAIDEVFG